MSGNSKGSLRVSVGHGCKPAGFGKALREVRKRGVNITVYEAPQGLRVSCGQPVVEFTGVEQTTRRTGVEEGLKLIRRVIDGELK